VSSVNHIIERAQAKPEVDTKPEKSWEWLPAKRFPLEPKLHDVGIEVNKSTQRVPAYSTRTGTYKNIPGKGLVLVPYVNARPEFDEKGMPDTPDAIEDLQDMIFAAGEWITEDARTEAEKRAAQRAEMEKRAPKPAVQVGKPAIPIMRLGKTAKKKAKLERMKGG